jgi:predicted kinase/DNA-binding PadR family transcriptional regulator
VGRGLAEIWPRADRQRYNAPKRLLAEGLVTARTEATGRRERTVYSITPAGRRALAAWLATEPRPPELEFEGMLRVILADEGTIEDLRATLGTMREQALEKRALFLAHAEMLLDQDGGTFPERAHVLVLANRFMLDHFEHIADWADWALEQTASWPDTTTPATTHRSASRAILRRSLEREPGAVPDVRLLLTCGLPGAGKTTLARQLAAERGAVRLTSDEWLWALGSSPWDAGAHGRMERALWHHAQEVLRLGTSVVLDFGLWSRRERDELRTGARALGVGVELHVLDLPADELWPRIEARNALPEWQDRPIRRADLDEWVPRFEAPDDEELALFDPPPD